MNYKIRRNHVLSLLSLSLILVLTACGSKTPVEPTADANAIYTAAAETVQAQLTQQAALNPTATTTALPTNTLAPIPTLAPVMSTAIHSLHQRLQPLFSRTRYSYIGQNPADDTQIPANQAFDWSGLLKIWLTWT